MDRFSACAAAGLEAGAGADAAGADWAGRDAMTGEDAAALGLAGAGLIGGRGGGRDLC